MDVHTAVRRLGRIEYTVLRAPVGLFDERVVRRYLDEGSPVRQSFERALDTADRAVAGWLGDSAATDARRASPAGRAAPATHRTNDVPPQDEPSEDVVASQDEPSEADEAQQVDDLTEEILEEEETETFAGELAENDDLRQVQAELAAKRLIEEQRGE